MPIIEAMACGAATRRVGARVDGRGLGRRRRPRRSGRPRGDRRGDPEALERRDELRPGRDRACARSSRGAPRGSRSGRLRGGRRRDPGRGRRLAARCRRAPGRRGTFAGCWARSRGGTGRGGAALVRRRRAGRPRSRGTRGGTTPGCRAPARGARPAPLHDLPRPAARASVPFLSRCTISRSSGIPSSSRAGTGSRAAPGSVRRRGQRTGSSPSPSSRSGRPSSLLGVDLTERVVVIGNAHRAGVHSGRGRRRGRATCSRSRRSSRARTSVGSSRRPRGPASSCGWSARAAGAASRRRGWVGEVDDEELAALYRGARALVFPSLYEGFGIPVARGDGVRHARRDERRRRDRGGGGGARRCSSTRSTSRRSRPGSRRPSSRREELRPLGLERAATTRGRRSPTRSRRVWRELA